MLSYPAGAKTIAAEGTLEPTSVVEVSSHVSGIVQDVACDADMAVKKGQICAKIDPRPFEASVQQASAAVDTAKAQLSVHEAALGYAKATFERNAKLVQRDAVSRASFEGAQSNYEQVKSQVEFAKATIAQRKAELETAKLNLGYTDIVAPFDGVILAKRVGPGESVAATLQPPPLFVMASDLRRMLLNVLVDEADLAAVQPNDDATFTVKAFSGKTFNAKVARVRNSPERTASGTRYIVVLEVDNKDMQLKPGMSASVKITPRQK
jgi:HlyD family secretion protein